MRNFLIDGARWGLVFPLQTLAHCLLLLGWCSEHLLEGLDNKLLEARSE